MTVRQFRKRPVVVSAIQWTGDNEREIREWCGLAETYEPVNADA